MKISVFVLGMSLASIGSFAQNDWLSFPGEKKDATKDSVIARPAKVSLNYNVQKKGKVTLHQDARIDKLGEFVRVGESSLEGVKIDGYRIVIFFDQSKSKVEQEKASFLSRYSEHKAYIDYVAPHYRVRVGNFRTQLEAEALKAELINSFPTAIVVEDKIQLPELPDTTTTVVAP